jgi:outer membrane lipoprotein-sorting protein
MTMRGVAALALWICAQAANAADWDLARLMDLLKSSRPGKATFHETRHIAILEQPVESSGELIFTPPDRLEKRTLGLNAERTVVDRETLTVERRGRKQTFALRDDPQIGVLVESIRGTLAGDRASLEKTYSLALEGSPDRWRLTLKPRDPELAKIVSRIEIGGSQARVQRIDIQQADGDHSLMVVTPVAP